MSRSLTLVGMLLCAGILATAARAANPVIPPMAPPVTAPAAQLPTRDPSVQRAIDAIPRQLRINIAWQVALDGADFSPGIIDGVFKKKGTMALTEYAARNFPGSDTYDP